MKKFQQQYDLKAKIFLLEFKYSLVVVFYFAITRVKKQVISSAAELFAFDRNPC